MPRDFSLHVPDPDASFDLGWFAPGLEPAGALATVEARRPKALPPAAAPPAPAAPPIYERPAWFDTDEDVLGWTAEEALAPLAPEPVSLLPLEPARQDQPAPVPDPPQPKAPPRPLLPPGVRPAAPMAHAADGGLWDAPQRRPGFVAAPPARKAGRRRLLLIGAAVVLIPLIGAALMLATRLIGPTRPASISAVYTAPIMVLRAAAAGRIDSIAVANGQVVDPATVLLTIHAEPPPDPAAVVLRDRLAGANDRAAVLDATLGGPPPNTDSGRARLADTKRLRAAATAEINQIQAALAAVAPRPAADTAVKAGLNGKVWSVDSTPGTSTAAGAPLVRLLDCDHAFLTLAAVGQLRAGQAVEVRMPGLAPIRGAVRLASGIAEPTGNLVVEPEKIPGPNGCPVGLAAAIAPVASK